MVVCYIFRVFWCYSGHRVIFSNYLWKFARYTYYAWRENNLSLRNKTIAQPAHNHMQLAMCEIGRETDLQILQAFRLHNSATDLQNAPRSYVTTCRIWQSLDWALGVNTYIQVSVHLSEQTILLLIRWYETYLAHDGLQLRAHAQSLLLVRDTNGMIKLSYIIVCLLSK